VNENEGAFGEIDGKARGGDEAIKNRLKVSHMLQDSPDNDKSVIGILEDRARKVMQMSKSRS
jgi:hypothetical protein